MELRALRDDEIKNIFYHHIQHDFPKNEIRPLKSMLTMKHQERYLGYGLFDHEELLGYAFFASCSNSLLLDYFAIVKGKRDQGLGSKFLEMLLKELSSYFIIAEVESTLTTNNEDERLMRTRRLNFYLKNQFKRTNIQCHLYFVDYHIIYYYKETLPDEKIYSILETLYHSLYSPLAYKSFIRINLK